MKPVIVWILVVVLAGCTTLRPVENASDPADVKSKVHVNDRVQVTTRDGQSNYFLVTDIGPETIAGNTRRGRHVEVPYQQISSLEVRRVNAPRSWALVGVLLVGGVLYSIAFARAFYGSLTVQ